MLFAKEEEKELLVLKRPEMLKYLKNQAGVDMEYVKSLDISDLREYYAQFLRNKLAEIRDYKNKELHGVIKQMETVDLNLKDYWEKIKEGLDTENYKLIYDTLYESIKTHPFNDIVEMLSNNTDDDVYKWIFKASKIVLREVQESIMYEAYNMYNDMPDEERYIQLTKLGKRKKSMNAAGMLPKNKKDEITQIATIKQYLLKNVLEDEYQKEYGEYFNEVFLKRELIDKILDIDENNVYDEDNLKPRNTEELKAIRVSIIREKRELKKEARRLDEYVEKLKSAISQNDEQGFYFLTTDAFKELGHDVMKFKLLPSIDRHNQLASNKMRKILSSKREWQMYDPSSSDNE